MVHVVLAIRDQKMEAFLPPVFVRNVAVGIRMLEQAVADVASDFAKFPDDYALFQLGEWEDSDGTFQSIVPRLVCSARSLLKVVQ